MSNKGAKVARKRRKGTAIQIPAQLKAWEGAVMITKSLQFGGKSAKIRDDS
jgi:hypothetical protein